MEEVTVSRMQAVELAKAIVEARDAELAFLLQVQEIMKSTSDLPEHEVPGAGEDDLELDPSQQLLAVKDAQAPSDIDKGAALNLAVDELGSFVEETEETQLSLLEAARLARLDAIQEHDAQFARSLANIPQQDWDRIGVNMADPFTAPSDSRDPFLNEVDEYDAVLSLLDDGVTSRGSGGRYNSDAAGEVIRVMQRAKLCMTPLTIRENTSPRRCILDPKQQGKGKEKVVVVQEDDGGIFPDDSPFTFDSPSTKTDEPLNTAGLSIERGATETDVNAGDSGIQICQICFEATQLTSTFVTLEGCGHQFCSTCVTRHAEARIQYGGQMHVSCLHSECPALISFTQLSFLLSSSLLEVLTRRQIEAAIPESERMYCPFRDCSALLMKPARADNEKPSSSAHPPPLAASSSSCVECEACHRAFCVECVVPWHGDLSCGEFQANLKNLRLLGDEKLLQLADQQKWQRCKKCGRLVELSSGCFHMTCLCKNEFCYSCGASWRGGGKTCSCPRWTESRFVPLSTAKAPGLKEIGPGISYAKYSTKSGHFKFKILPEHRWVGAE